MKTFQLFIIQLLILILLKNCIVLSSKNIKSCKRINYKTKYDKECQAKSTKTVFTTKPDTIEEKNLVNIINEKKNKTTNPPIMNLTNENQNNNIKPIINLTNGNQNDNTKANPEIIDINKKSKNESKKTILIQNGDVFEFDLYSNLIEHNIFTNNLIKEEILKNLNIPNITKKNPDIDYIIIKTSPVIDYDIESNLIDYDLESNFIENNKITKIKNIGETTHDENPTIIKQKGLDIDYEIVTNLIENNVLSKSSINLGGEEHNLIEIYMDNKPIDTGVTSLHTNISFIPLTIDLLGLRKFVYNHSSDIIDYDGDDVDGGMISFTVEYLNMQRKSLNATAMHKITWDHELVQIARIMLKGCGVEFSDLNSMGALLDFNYFVIDGTYDFSLTLPLTAWYKQGVNYILGTSKEEGFENYINMVNSKAEKIGCATTRCLKKGYHVYKIEDSSYTDKHFICVFNNGGRKHEDPPYISGKACSGCNEFEICNENFCDTNWKLYGE